MISLRKNVSLSSNSRSSSHMENLHIFLVALLGVASHGHDLISGSVLEKTVRPGENITLYCDCTLSSGVYIVWYRNCSHENQPSLVLRSRPLPESEDFTDNRYQLKLPPRFHLVINYSSESYDLLILNITDSDEGFYYCGTEQTTVENAEYINRKMDYRYGNVTTRILFNSIEPHHETPRDCGECCILLFSLCPAFAVLSSLLSSLLVYHLCRKKAKDLQADQRRPETSPHQDEDVCYAALEIRQASQRPKKKKTQSSDFSTYSAINTSRV
ncbi:uncharacterized protein LOC129116255 [Anoplopoma fimbria]|uniref:uncharacterized protein LOC129116255 n=1 Tax=Anoplopoma fimbria TaxID=229290 RepID=UPI0023EAC10C|nr:uncharacterized protein LOC129116255 [Anoplopoma fimbria]